MATHNADESRQYIAEKLELVTQAVAELSHSIGEELIKAGVACTARVPTPARIPRAQAGLICEPVWSRHQNQTHQARAKSDSGLPCAVEEEFALERDIETTQTPFNMSGVDTVKSFGCRRKIDLNTTINLDDSTQESSESDIEEASTLKAPVRPAAQSTFIVQDDFIRTSLTKISNQLDAIEQKLQGLIY